MTTNAGKITPQAIRAMKGEKRGVPALTAYDYPMTRMLDEAGVPLLLVGDSLGMVILGLPGHDARDHGGYGASRARRRSGQAARAAGGGSALRFLRNRGASAGERPAFGGRGRRSRESRRRPEHLEASRGDRRRGASRTSVIWACFRRAWFAKGDTASRAARKRNTWRC